MAQYEIVLKKGGRIMRRMGNYPSQAAAKSDAQVLADNAAASVKVYVQPMSAKKAAHLKAGGRDPSRKRRRNSNWIQGVDREIEARGTEGAFTAQARRAGYSDTMEFARKVMAGWRSGKKTVYNKKTRRQQRITEKTMDRANFAINVQKRNPQLTRQDLLQRGEKSVGVASRSMDQGWYDLRGTPYEKRANRISNELFSLHANILDQTDVNLTSPAQARQHAMAHGAIANPSSWDQAEYRCTAGTEGRLRKAAKAKGYKDVMLFADKVMDGWRKNKRVWNKKTKKWNLIDKKLMQSANFAVNSQAGLYKKNPDWGKVGSAIGRGVRKTGSMIAEGGRRAGEEAKRATLMAKAKDLDLCAGRLGINVKDLLDGALDPRATLDQMADRIAEAHNRVSHHSMDIDRRRSSRRTNPSHQSYFTAYTRPESGFRYFSKHNSKTTANKAAASYKRRGYSNVRITKSRPKSALPAGLLAKV